MAQPAKPPTPRQDINANTLGGYAEQLQQTTAALNTYLVNIDRLLDTSDTGAYWLLRMITDRFDFIANDLQREADGKRPLDGTEFKNLDFSNECKARCPYLDQPVGGVQ